MDLAEEVWHSDEVLRTVVLTMRYPSLLNSEQRQLHELLITNRYFTDPIPSKADVSYDGFAWVKWRRIRESWSLLKQVAAGLIAEDQLPREDRPMKASSDLAADKKSSTESTGSQLTGEHKTDSSNSTVKKTNARRMRAGRLPRSKPS
jgi:hypothetical protein